MQISSTKWTKFLQPLPLPDGILNWYLAPCQVTAENTTQAFVFLASICGLQETFYFTNSLDYNGVALIRCIQFRQAQTKTLMAMRQMSGPSSHLVLTSSRETASGIPEWRQKYKLKKLNLYIIIKYNIYFLLSFLSQDLMLYSRLALNSWQSTCLSLPNASLTDMHHHIHPKLHLFVN